METDVVVVGAGGAGLVAALVAADEGARVIQLDKGSQLGGTFLISEGTSVGAGTKLQYENGTYDDSPMLFYADCLNEPRAREVCDSEGFWYYCENARFAIDWLDSLGAYSPEERICITPIYGEQWSRPRVFRCADSKGYLKAILGEHRKRVDRGDIKVLLDTTVTKIIKNNGRVCGVTVKHSGGDENIHAGAVIICSGGFSGSVDLMRRYKFPGARDIISAGWPDATGECMEMCREADAAMVNLDQELLPYIGGVSNPSHPGRAIAHVNMNGYPGAVWVDNHGKRITNEYGGQYLPVPRIAALNAPEMVINVIWDHGVLEVNDSIMVPWLGDVPARSWEWVQQEAAKDGAVKSADTVSALAAKLGINPDGLVATIERWNTAVSLGQDTDFGRDELRYSLINPPFYGVATVPSILISAGGPAVNVRQQVLNESGKAIAGLYAAGEVTGYRAFGTGGMNTGNVVYGKQAGQQAAWYTLGCHTER